MKKIFALFMVMALTACGANLDLDRYETSGAGNVNTVSEGVIISARPVTIATENGDVGQLAGGIIGGFAGRQISDNTTTQNTCAEVRAAMCGYTGGQAHEGVSGQGG